MVFQKVVDFRLKPAYNTHMDSKKRAKQPMLRKSNTTKKRLQIVPKAHIIDIVVS